MGALSFAQAKQSSITRYLSSLGFEPVRVRGNDQWYYSPFRTERTPSFKVNTKLNVWYDHGSGEGGTILDFGAKLHRCSLAEFANKLAEAGLVSTVAKCEKLPFVEDSGSAMRIKAVGELCNYGLLHYLKSRSISSEVARTYCKEVDFSINNRRYKAVGFLNKSGGWEVRNNWFKGSSSPKDVSYIDNGSNHLTVLEGFMDFLSLKQLENSGTSLSIPHSNFLVLNSLSLLNRSIPAIQSHEKVTLLLDNDSAAKAAKEGLVSKGIRFSDASPFYQHHKDVNEYLMALHRNKLDHVRSHGKSKGLRR